MLKALVAKEGLDHDEIVGAFAKRRTTIANELLSVRRDRRVHQYSCGDNPWFLAQVVDETIDA